MGYRLFQADLSGRVALVTGANSGMGKETARELARMGAQVILACRSQERGEAAANDIIETTGSTSVTVMQVDLSSPASVRALDDAVAERFPKLDVQGRKAPLTRPGSGVGSGRPAASTAGPRPGAGPGRGAGTAGEAVQ